MKAIVYTEYGTPDVLQLRDVPKPVPKDNEILVRVLATPVSFGDVLARNFKKITPGNFSMPSPLWLPTRMVFGFSRPKKNILGSEFAGLIESVGKDVSLFKKGDQVFGYRGAAFGAYAEYLCMPETQLVALKPANMSHSEAASISYGALTALSLLRKANIQKGQRVLINGASGGIGSAAVQLAKYYGAEVTGVCGPERLALVKSLGADAVVDYTSQDFTRNGIAYDLILDVLGKSSFAACHNSLTRNGMYLRASFKTRHLLQMLGNRWRGGKKIVCAMSFESVGDLHHITQLIEAGTLKSVVDRVFPLEQAADAHRYAESGHKKGNVVLTMGGTE